MSDNLSPFDRAKAQVVARLVKETGITSEQAETLVKYLGLEWSSLMREARLMARDNG